MTNLSNASLLDEQVGGNLKNERLQKTAEIAQNPNTERVQPIQQPIQQMQPMQQQPIPQMKQTQSQNIERNSNVTEEEHIPNNLPIRDYSKKKASSDDDKILGMKPVLFYGLLTVVLVAGGYFAYTKFIKKGKGGKSLDAGAGSSSGAAPKIVDVPITTG